MAVAKRKGRSKRDPSLTEGFARRLKAARLDAELTQLEVGAALSNTVDPKIVGRWENNKSTPTLDRVIELAGIVDCDLGYLITGEMRAASTQDSDDPALAMWLERAMLDDPPPTKAEIEALRSIRAPEGKRLTPGSLEWFLRELRDLPEEVGPQRPSKAAAGRAPQKGPASKRGS